MENLPQPNQVVNDGDAEQQLQEVTGDNLEPQPRPTQEETIRLLVDSRDENNAIHASMKAMEKEVSRMKRLLSDVGLSPDDDETSSPAFDDENPVECGPEQPAPTRRNKRAWRIQRFFARFAEEADKEEEQEDLTDSLPEDSFSLMLVSPVWSIPYLSASGVLCVQVLTYFLLTWNQVHGNNLGIPSMVTPAVRFTQILALIITALTQDLLRTGLLEFYKGYVPETVGQSFEHISAARWYINSTLRCVEGALGLLVTFTLIMTATTVIDLLLNFTAMEFVSQVDEIFFSLALHGFVGKKNRVQAEVVADTKYKAATISVNGVEERRRYRRLYIIMILIMGILFGGWSVVVFNQSTGIYFCQTIQVQFDDEFVPSLGSFSGLYDLVPNHGFAAFAGRQVKYKDRLSGRAYFDYCTEHKVWTFSYREDGGEPDPCKDWVLFSSKTDTFDVTDLVSFDWTVRSDDREIALDHFHLECMDCENVAPGHSECYGRGTCSDAVCTCNEGWYGLRCEFHEPCAQLEMDVRFAGFEDSKPWSASYEFLKDGNNVVTAYGRPVYVGTELPDVLVFTGRRWMATYAELLNVVSSDDFLHFREIKALLARYFLDSFHAYYSDMEVSFLTEPVDIGTELNSVQPTELGWYAAAPKNEEHHTDVQGVDRAVDRMDAALLCSICDSDENVCRNGGVCVEGKCQCVVGSEGGLCQVPPVGNGRCDPQFDTPKYGWDDGDCCEFSCISGNVYQCGKDETGFIDIGYPFCVDRGDTMGTFWYPNRIQFDYLKTQSRHAVVLSSQGNILALGEPNADQISLYDSEGSEWIPRGRIMEGPLGSDFGAHIAMSRGLPETARNHLAVDPVRLAVTGRFHDEGFVRVFECLNRGCLQSGEDLTFANLEEDSRALHAISADGRTLAFGGFNEDTSSTVIRFYQFNIGLGLWLPNNSSTFEYAGNVYSIAFSSNFSTMAVRTIEISQEEGSPDEEFEPPTFRAFDGRITFQFWENKWVQLGESELDEIDGHGRSDNPEDFHILDTQHRLAEYIHGSNPIAFSDNGQIMATGYSISKTNPGVGVFVFDQQARDWILRGQRIWNDLFPGFEGWSVALSGDGDVLVVGTGGDDTRTETYKWNGQDWEKCGHHLPGGTFSSIAISADASVLAVGQESVDVYHRDTTPKCADDEVPFRLSLTLDTHPQDTYWNLFSNTTKEEILSGGPYEGPQSEFPYPTAYERSTVVAHQCVRIREDCVIFSIYDKINPAAEEFEKPDGMLVPGIYSVSVNNTTTSGRLDQAARQVKIGDKCLTCPDGTQSVKVLVRSCVPFSWTLDQEPSTTVLDENNYYDFGNDFQYTADMSCRASSLPVKTYWKETCLPASDVENECFSFHLGSHPAWPVAQPGIVDSVPGDIPDPEYVSRNVEIALFLNEEEFQVDFAFLGVEGTYSAITGFFGGACDSAD